MHPSKDSLAYSKWGFFVSISTLNDRDAESRYTEHTLWQRKRLFLVSMHFSKCALEKLLDGKFTSFLTSKLNKYL
jgi:hypothetical protein